MARVAVAVVGPGSCDTAIAAVAYEVGRRIALRGAVLITGGVSGVMEAASHGAHAAGGLVVGILPDSDSSTANAWVDVAIPTGMGQLRNGLVVLSADAVIAIAGEWGTLSEIALAKKLGRPVVGLHTWSMMRDDGTDGELDRADSPEEAVRAAMRNVAQ